MNHHIRSTNGKITAGFAAAGSFHLQQAPDKSQVRLYIFEEAQY